MKKSTFTKLFILLWISTILFSCSKQPCRFEKTGAYQITVDSISVKFSEMGHDPTQTVGKIIDSLITFTDNKNDTTFNRSNIVSLYCLDSNSVYMDMWGKVYSLPYDKNTDSYHITKETEYLNEFTKVERCYTDISIVSLSSNQYNIRLYKLYDCHEIEILITAHNDVELFKPMKRDEVLKHIECIRFLGDIERDYNRMILVEGHPELNHFFKQWEKFLILH